MSGTALIDCIRQTRHHGGTIRVNATGKLVVDFGSSHAPRALVELLREHKAELTRIYGGASPSAAADHNDDRGIPYRWWKPGDQLPATTIGFDTETEAVGDINDPGSQPPRLVVATATDGTTGFYVSPDQLRAFLDAHTHATFVVHNVQFDAMVCERALADHKAGSFWPVIDEGRMVCTMTLERLLSLATTGTAQVFNSLDDLAQKYLGRSVSKDVTDSAGDPVRTSFGKYIGRPHTDIEQVALDYAAGDTDVVLQIWREQLRALDSLKIAARDAYGFPGEDALAEAWSTYGPLTLHTQVKAMILAKVMSINGVCFDLTRREEALESLKAAQAEATTRLRNLGIPVPVEPEIEALTGLQQWEIDELPNKVPAVQTSMGRYLAEVEPQLLTDGILPEPFARTETGRISMSKQHRARWVALGVSEVVNAWADWEHARKFRRTYAEKMSEPRIHPRWNPLLNSGRFSATGTIALQTLPKCFGTPDDRLTIRQLVVPPEGHVFVAVDFSQIEVVALAAVMETQTGYGSGLADVIRRGLDVHSSIAHCLYPNRDGPITAAERKAVKPITFGLPGGMGAKTIQQVAKLNYGLDLEVEEVEAIMAAYKQLAPELEHHLARKVCPGMKTAQFLGMRSRGEGWQVLNVLGGTACNYNGIPLTEDEASPMWAMAERFKPILPGNKKTREALAKAIDNREPSPTLTAAVRNAMTEEMSCTMTGRLRARCNFRSARNNTFQGLAADGAILAMWKLFRTGFNLAMFVHDEIVATCPNDGRAHLRADVMSGIMRDEMAKVLGGQLPVGVEAFVSSSFSQRDQLAPGEIATARQQDAQVPAPATGPVKATSVTVQGPTKRKAVPHDIPGSNLARKVNPKAISWDDDLGDIPF